MNTATDRYLDAVKSRLNIPSDYKLAQHWHVTQQRISEYRRGVTSFSDERCIEIARILDLPAEQVLFEIQAERARKAGKSAISDILEDVLRRLKTAPAVLAYLAIFTGTAMPPSSAEAADFDCAPVQLPAHRHNANCAIIDIMSNCLRRIGAVFRALSAQRWRYFN